MPGSLCPIPILPVEETLGALADIVRQGKALYAGISKYYKPTQAEEDFGILKRLGTPCLHHNKTEEQIVPPIAWKGRLQKPRIHHRAVRRRAIAGRGAAGPAHGRGNRRCPASRWNRGRSPAGMQHTAGAAPPSPAPPCGNTRGRVWYTRRSGSTSDRARCRRPDPGSDRGSRLRVDIRDSPGRRVPSVRRTTSDRHVPQAARYRRALSPGGVSAREGRCGSHRAETRGSIRLGDGAIVAGWSVFRGFSAVEGWIHLSQVRVCHQYHHLPFGSPICILYWEFPFYTSGNSIVWK